MNIKVIVDKLTGENKGFAYISFSKASEAAYALEECDPSRLLIQRKVLLIISSRL
jgi:RNA recognition motif-containing protein